MDMGDLAESHVSMSLMYRVSGIDSQMAAGGDQPYDVATAGTGTEAQGG